MRKDKLKKKKAIIILLFLLIILFALLSKTYAKYLTQIQGKGIIDVANWSFIVNGQTSSMTNINLAQTYDEKTLLKDKIAPGTKGSFDIIIDTTGSDVGIEYDVKFLNEKEKPHNLKFKYDDTTVSSITELEEKLKGVISANEEEKIKTLTIEWSWDYQTGNTEELIENSDIKDTQDGIKLGEYSFDIVVTGKQIEIN